MKKSIVTLLSGVLILLAGAAQAITRSKRAHRWRVFAHITTILSADRTRCWSDFEASKEALALRKLGHGEALKTTNEQIPRQST